MAPTTDASAVEREIATIRCLVAQQLHALERTGEDRPERRAADGLLRRLLRRDEDLRQRLAEARQPVPRP